MYKIFSRAICGLMSLAILTLSSCASIPNYVNDAVNSPARDAAAVERDGTRLPAEVLALSGIKPGDSVIEFAGFGQYYTTMLSEIVGSTGSVAMFDLPYTEERAGDNSRAFVAGHPNTSYTLVNYNEINLPSNADLVFNVLYYHDLALNDIDTAKLNKRIFDALKPGGVFILIDHNARPGSGTTDTETLHRIDPAVIKQELAMAGFVLVEESDLLAHPEDDHSQMVFTPGVRGLTDRTVFKFMKPE